MSRPWRSYLGAFGRWYRSRTGYWVQRSEKTFETFDDRLKRIIGENRDVLNDPRMADDYNPETGERDGIPYWERKQSHE